MMGYYERVPQMAEKYRKESRERSLERLTAALTPPEEYKGQLLVFSVIGGLMAMKVLGKKPEYPELPIVDQQTMFKLQRQGIFPRRQ